MELNLNLDELVKKEIRQQVSQKVGTHFHAEIKKEMSKSTLKNDVREYVENEFFYNIDIDDIVKYIDFEKIQNKVIEKVSEHLIDRITY